MPRIFDRFGIDYLLRNVDQWLLSSIQVTHSILIGRRNKFGKKLRAFQGEISSKTLSNNILS